MYLSGSIPRDTLIKSITSMDSFSSFMFMSLNRNLTQIAGTGKSKSNVSVGVRLVLVRVNLTKKWETLRSNIKTPFRVNKIVLGWSQWNSYFVSIATFFYVMVRKMWEYQFYFCNIQIELEEISQLLDLEDP